MNHFLRIGIMFGATCLLASCADNDAVRARYNIEKAFFKAEKSFRKAGMKPELTDAASLRQLRTLYDSVLRQSYQALATIDDDNHSIERGEIGELAFGSASRLTQLLFSAGKYDSCVVVLNRLLSKNIISNQSRMRVYQNLGRALQADGQFDSALTVMDNVVDEFSPPLTVDGRLYEPVFNLPSQIYSLFLTMGDSAGAKERFIRAEKYYRQFADYSGVSNLAEASHNNLAQLYGSVGRWRDEINELWQLRDSTGETYTMSIIQIADIYSNGLSDYDRAITLYDSLRSELSGRDTLLEPPLLLKRSIAEIGQKRYARARSSLVELERNYPGYFAGTALAQYSKAQTFDLEGNWDRAELEYKYLIEQYTGSVESMSTYLYLAKQYTERSRTELARRWYDRAIKYYDLIVQRGAGNQASSRAMLFKAEAYRRMKEFPRAATTLLDLYTRNPKTKTGQLAIIEAARIYKYQLGQPETADSLIERLKSALADVDAEPKM